MPICWACLIELVGKMYSAYSKNGLRDYQQEMIARIREAWKTSSSVMVQMPTGTGKTHVLAAVVGEAEGGVLVVAHRIELITQISEMLAGLGVGHGVIAQGNCPARMCRVMVASVQTLARRLDVLDMNPSMVIVDEAHHALAKTYQAFWERWPDARFLGMTATPCRMNNKGFLDLFDTLLQSWDIGRFIEKGWLSDFEYISVRPDSRELSKVASLRKRGADGDYQLAEMATVMDCPESIARLYESYSRFAEGRKGIVYAIDCNHARHIAEHYTDKGVKCCVIDAKTSAVDRKRLVEDYRRHEVDVMINVDIFSEGFDCPEVEFIQLARPTLSLSKYLQQVGRGMRIGEGKSHVLILDQVGLYQTFGLPTDDRDWARMFAGMESGKGIPGKARGIVLREEEDDRALANLEMVRIKRTTECRQGLEIFVQNGKYGVMMDGVVTCKPSFEKMERIGEYWVASYPYRVFMGRKTMIDRRGNDLHVALYGIVEQEGDFYHARDVHGKDVWWDSKGGRYYPAIPRIVCTRYLEMAGIGDRYWLRKNIGDWGETYAKDEIWENGAITVLGNRAVVKNDVMHSFLIKDIREESLRVVRKERNVPVAYCMRPDGRIFSDWLRFGKGGEVPCSLNTFSACFGMRMAIRD